MRTFLFFLLTLGAVSAGYSQSRGAFALDWQTIDGGGHACSGGAFTLSGTVGQPEASQSAGGAFSLESGFWSGISLQQSPGAPQLQIRLALGPRAVLSWPVSVTGFTLEYTTDLNPGVWLSELTTVQDTATERSDCSGHGRVAATERKGKRWAVKDDPLPAPMEPAPSIFYPTSFTSTKWPRAANCPSPIGRKKIARFIGGFGSSRA